MSDDRPKPGKGLLGWLGRQVGYVKKAVKADPAAEKKLFEKKRVEEHPHPENPNIKLRRTVIDEAIEKRSDQRSAVSDQPDKPAHSSG